MSHAQAMLKYFGHVGRTIYAIDKSYEHLRAIGQFSHLASPKTNFLNPISSVRKNETSCVISETNDKQNRRTMTTSSLDKLNFTNTPLRELPVEANKGSDYRLVKDAAFCFVDPTPLDNPRLISASRSALDLVDITLESSKSNEFLQYFSGNKHLPGSEPAAHCYCGYQYGLFSGQLGDGAAMYLGSVKNLRGEQWEMQLKGTGRTPFGRAGADGRKVLRSSIREFLCSEAMHHLGIPTTRAGCLIGSDTQVYRDALWTGTQEAETAAVVLRIAPTFFRIGSLEVCNSEDPNTGLSGPSAGNIQLLKELVDYTIKYFYPHIHTSSLPAEDKYLKFYEEVIQSTGRLVAEWQCVGFCHGVLNTDNISLVGLTMDYGPFNFLEQYDPDHICNGSDFWARHTYRKQMEDCRWCCEQLAETLHPLVDQNRTKDRLHLYDEAFNETYLSKMRQKLGLSIKEDDDKFLIESLLETMRLTGADFTLTFRALSSLHLPGAPDFETSKTKLNTRLINSSCNLEKLKSTYNLQKHATPNELQLSLWVLQMNPQLVPRYVHMARQSVDELNARDIIQHVQNLTEETKKAQDEKLWSEWIEKYITRLNREVFQNETVKTQNEDRARIMNQVNPRFVLRRSILQEAIAEAEKGNYDMVNVLLRMVEDPFSEKPGQRGENSEADQVEMKRILGMFDRGINSETCRITCSS